MSSHGLHIRPGRHRSGGFTLVSILAALVIYSFGLLSLVGAYTSIVAASTQNQNLSLLTGMSEGFGGVLQANPGLLTAGMTGTAYTSANISSAPAALQPWLTQWLSTTSPTSLPQGSVLIQTGPDAAWGTACSTTDGCSVTLVVSWVQARNANAATTSAVTRSQTFYFQQGF